MKKKYKFIPVKPKFNFKTDWGVYQVKNGSAGNSSMCYTTSKDRARLISIALNRFLNSDEGVKWLEIN